MELAAPYQLNFPAFTTPLIGRDADVAIIVERLRSSSHRFATLVGTSGTGKTRLSMQIATAMTDDFPNGMAFVPLASITDPALVIPTIARTFSLTETGTSTYLETLAQHLNHQTVLLVLDNFEQVVDAAPMVMRLLAQTPNVHVLCTSQIPANLEGEDVIEIPPLALPQVGDSLAALEASPAVALFVERIRRVQPYFKLTDRSASAVSELCRRLYGLPLAIELVATHSDRLQPENLLLLLRAYLPQERDRRGLLTYDQVIFPVLSWCVSYGPPSIRWLLPRLGVLWGEWRIEQAAALTSDAPPSFNLATTLNLMVSKGLLLSMNHGDEPTYTMLDAIRQYAAKRLETDEKLAEAVRGRHVTAFSALASKVDTGLRTGEGSKYSGLFSLAMPNIRAALQWLYEQQRFAEAATIIGSMALPSYYQGYIRETLTWIGRLTPHINQIPDDVQMALCYAHGILSYAVADYPVALHVYEQGIMLARTLGNDDYMARFLNNKAIILSIQGLNTEAREVYFETLELRQKQNDLWGIATIYNNIAVTLKDEGNFEEALKYNSLSLDISRKQDDDIGIATSICNIADLKYSMGFYDESEALYREGLTICSTMEESSLVATMVGGLGRVLLKQDPDGTPPEAETMLREAVLMAGRLEAFTELAGMFEDYASWLLRVQRFQAAAHLVGAAARMRTDYESPYTNEQAQDVRFIQTVIDTQIGEAARLDAETIGTQLSIPDLLGIVTGT